MMWTRLGFIVPLVWVGLAIVFSKIGLKTYLPQPFDACVVLFLCALIYYAVGKNLNKENAVDTKGMPAKALNNKSHHTFFFIKIEYWSFIALALITVILVNHFLS